MIKNLFKRFFKFEQQKSVSEILEFHEKRLGGQFYPESELYFSLAQKILEKYPAEEWSIEDGSFLERKIKHSKCKVMFSYDSFMGKRRADFLDRSVLTENHGRNLAELLSVAIDKSEEIYENDIVSLHRSCGDERDSSGDISGNFKTLLRKGEWLLVGDNEEYFLRLEPDFCKVIGNINENPELLAE